jgi:hypothetical protein
MPKLADYYLKDFRKFLEETESGISGDKDELEYLRKMKHSLVQQLLFELVKVQDAVKKREKDRPFRVLMSEYDRLKVENLIDPLLLFIDFLHGTDPDHPDKNNQKFFFINKDHDEAHHIGVLKDLLSADYTHASSDEGVDFYKLFCQLESLLVYYSVLNRIAESPKVTRRLDLRLAQLALEASFATFGLTSFGTRADAIDKRNLPRIADREDKKKQALSIYSALKSPGSLANATRLVLDRWPPDKKKPSPKTIERYIEKAHAKKSVK